MRKFIIIILCIAFSGVTAQAYSFGFTETKSIRSQMMENNLSLASVTAGELTFAKQDDESGLGDIYEYKSKSPFKAFMLSMAVPGLGEYYLGSRIKAGSFFALDAILWTGYFIYRGKGNDKEQEYKDYAQEHYLWNTYIQWWDTVPDSIQDKYSHTLPWDSTAAQPIFNHEYYENIGKYHQFQVGWDDIGINNPPSPDGGFVSDHRAFYLNLRKKSNDYFTTASTIAMVSIANHIISAFDAAIGAKKYNKGAKEYSLKFKAKKYDGEMTPFLEFTAKF
jgi:hypothetical protein